MDSALSRAFHIGFAPPKYLTQPMMGVDLSTSGVKGALLSSHVHGIELDAYADIRFPNAAFTDGDITDRAAVIKALRDLAHTLGVTRANIALPESKSYLFETHAVGDTKDQRRVSVEQHIDEYIPLPPAEIAFDFVTTGTDQEG